MERNDIILISTALLSAGTPLMVIPILLSYAFNYPRSNKLLLFLFFLFFNIAAGNFVYVSFILLFLFSATKTTRTTFIIFTLLSILSMFLPFNFLTWQIILLAAGIVAMLFVALPGIVRHFFPKQAKRPISKADLYRRLAGR